MAKKIIREQLKKGESISGELEKVDDTAATLTTKDGVIRVPLPRHVLQVLDDDYYAGDDITITYTEKGIWEVDSAN